MEGTAHSRCDNCLKPAGIRLGGPRGYREPDRELAPDWMLSPCDQAPSSLATVGAEVVRIHLSTTNLGVFVFGGRWRRGGGIYMRNLEIARARLSNPAPSFRL